MRFYTKQHLYYCGVDLHARSLYVCILDQAGAVQVHRNLRASPEAFLQVIAPYRQDLAVAAECMFAKDQIVQILTVLRLNREARVDVLVNEHVVEHRHIR